MEGVTGVKRAREEDSLKTAFLALCARKPDGLPASLALKALKLTPEELVPVLGVCVAERRVEVYKTSRPDGGDEQLYKLISAERAEKLVGLSSEEEAVLALIEKSGSQGVWVRSLKMSTKLQQQQLNKILKRLEKRKLAKPIKSIAFKNRRMYMGFDFEPAKDLTGGVWYSEQQLDTEFIFHIRSAIIKILKEMGGTGTPAQVCEKVKLAGISRVVLKPTDVQQLMDTLVYEGWIDYEGVGHKRMAALHAPEAAEFPKKTLLLSEYDVKKGRGGRAGAGAAASSGGGDADDDDDDDDEDEEGDGGDDSTSRVYMLLPRRPIAHGDFLTTTPCGSCPVMSSCVPGGVISPETCVYMSHWLQW